MESLLGLGGAVKWSSALYTMYFHGGSLLLVLHSSSAFQVSLSRVKARLANELVVGHAPEIYTVSPDRRRHDIRGKWGRTWSSQNTELERLQGRRKPTETSIRRDYEGRA